MMTEAQPRRPASPTASAIVMSPTTNGDAADEQQLRGLALLKGMRFYYEQLSTIQRQLLENAAGLPLPPTPTIKQMANDSKIVFDQRNVKLEPPSMVDDAKHESPGNLSPTYTVCLNDVDERSRPAPVTRDDSLESQRSIVTPPALIDGSSSAVRTNSRMSEQSRRSNDEQPICDDEQQQPKSTLLIVSNTVEPGAGRSQIVYICSIKARLHHGEQIHIVTGDGQVHTTQAIQLGAEPDRQTPPSPQPPPISNGDQVPLLFGASGLVQQQRLLQSAAFFRQQQQLQSLVDAGDRELTTNGVAEMMLTMPVVRAHQHPSYTAMTFLAPPHPQSSSAHFYSPLSESTPKGDANQTINEIEAELLRRSKNTEEQLTTHKYPRGKLSSTSSNSSTERNVDGINLDEIKEFAKAFKMKRLSLGLTQTQVGQALSLTEGPAYSQSAICRFEKLDITPKSAQKIKPVLEKWIHEIDDKIQMGQIRPGLNSGLQQPPPSSLQTPTPPQSSQTSSMMPSPTGTLVLPTTLHHSDSGSQSPTSTPPSPSSDDAPISLSTIGISTVATGSGQHDGRLIGSHYHAPSHHHLIGLEAGKKRKRRTSFTPQALEILNRFFQRNTHPTGAEMTLLAESLNYDREVVRVWFCNKRQALKNTVKKLKQTSPVDDDGSSPAANHSNGYLFD